MTISRKANFHLRPSIANRPWKFYFEKTFRSVWMNEEKNMQISSLCTKTFKTTTDSREDFSIADWTDQNVRNRYSEKVNWLTVRIEWRSTITKDKFAVAIFTSSSGSQGTGSRYRNATISSFNISCTLANYFETFQRQEEQIYIKC